LNSRIGRKSQSSLLILVFLVSIFVVAFFYFLFTSSTLQVKGVKGMKLSKISNYLDILKGYSRHALLLSSHVATKKVALSGGEINEVGIPRNWICNEDVSPDVEDVRFFLSEETLKYLNMYLEKSRIEDLPEQDIQNYTCVDYDVDGVLNGENDEKFNVGSYGSKIRVKLENDIVSSDNNVYEEITENRFWFVYRKFKEWTPEGARILNNSVTDCLQHVCDCPPMSPDGICEPCENTCRKFQNCIEGAIENTLAELKFDDPYVTCDANLIGCYYDSGLCDECNTCQKEEAEELCAKELSFQSNMNTEPLNILYLQGDEICGSMEAIFTCRDYKYLLSVEGERNLVFSVRATIEVEQYTCS